MGGVDKVMKDKVTSKRKKNKYKGYHRIEEATGAILDSIWVKDDGSEIRIKIAWEDRELVFRQLKDGEVSL